MRFLPFYLLLFTNFLLCQTNKNEIEYLLLEKAKNYIYLDDNFDNLTLLKSDEKDSLLKNYFVHELECNCISLLGVKFYKITTSKDCECSYIVALELISNPRVYKLKGFRSNEFMFFFNKVLITECDATLYGKKNTRKNKLKVIKENFQIDEIDFFELYEYYSKINNEIVWDRFSCFKLKSTISY